MNITLSQAIDGFTLARQVAGCSDYTIRNYRLDLQRFSAFLDHDPPLPDITAMDVRDFLHQLQTTRLESAGVAPRPARIPSPKTVRNAHTTLSSLWTWALEEGYADVHVVRAVQAPRASHHEIQPLSQADVKALLAAITHSQPWHSQPETRNARPSWLCRRDRAIVLLLLDTGIRASELCDLTRPDVDLRQGTAEVRGKSRLNAGQGKQRVVYFGTRTRKALWQYLQGEVPFSLRGQDAPDPDRHLFLTTEGGPIDRRHLATHFRRLGRRAGVSPSNPHRFRHTFAINYIKNRGDPFTLQKLLGHGSLDMVKRYLAIAQVDCENGHRRAGPVDHWGL